jgi:Rha family phage regulatory protein
MKLEIAELTGKTHNNVLKDIRRILDEAGIGAVRFDSSYLSEQNKTLPCFNLPRLECDLVVSGYSAKYRLAIIKRWHELEVAKKINLTALYD